MRELFLSRLFTHSLKRTNYQRMKMSLFLQMLLRPSNIPNSLLETEEYKKISHHWRNKLKKLEQDRTTSVV